MDREELMRLLAVGPVEIRMNDGERYTVVHPGELVVSDISACILHRDDDKKLRLMILPLVTMSGVRPIEQTAS